jgi:hypothetical protein
MIKQIVYQRGDALCLYPAGEAFSLTLRSALFWNVTHPRKAQILSTSRRKPEITDFLTL